MKKRRYLFFSYNFYEFLACSKITKLTDLHDRIIVATAKLLNVSLIKDKTQNNFS
jgi:hypothetical protein